MTQYGLGGARPADVPVGLLASLHLRTRPPAGGTLRSENLGHRVVSETW